MRDRPVSSASASAPASRLDRLCPDCTAVLVPVATRPGFLQHYYCKAERLFWALYRDELQVCELAHLHVSFYEDYLAGIRG